MGDNFEVIVDLEATRDEAAAVAMKIIDFLSEQEIIDPTQATVFEESSIFPWGKNVILAVEEPQEFVKKFMWRKGLEVIVGRQVHGESEEAPIWIECPNCNNREEDLTFWHDAVADWEYAGGAGFLECQQCKVQNVLDNWKHFPLWVYSNLGLKFWNIPKLRTDFLNTLGEFLGHKIVLIEGNC